MIPVLLVSLLGLCRSGSAFNLDTRFPVLKEAGVPGGLFGFSVSLHRQSLEQQRYLLLSGAPQDAAAPNVKANRTGALYACPISSLTNDCFRVPIDPESDPQNNIIENMWLGVTVASQGPNGRVLVCGHRYTSVRWSGEEDQRRMIGKCYIIGNNLELNLDDDWQTYHNELCDPNSDFDATGMCQMGISGGFTSNMVYFGAPGAFTWQGSSYIIQRETIWDLKEIYYPTNKTFNIYMGYTIQVNSGILHKDQVTVVSSAPRWESKGAVFLLDVQNNIMVVKHVLNGQQVGSYFGSAIALADLNNDGWQDIVVGAPYYFDRKEETGGAVYVYNNVAGFFIDKAAMVLHGTSFSGFGFALANIGDINQDGFTDLAVGAPFDGLGKVYIYNSNADGPKQEPSQVIDGSQVANISTFGYSLSGGLDVDENAYPDLLVGSLTDRIALLRSRPVINISKDFKVTPTLVDPSKCSDTSCIDVRVCFSYTLSTGNAGYRKNITLQYTLEGDHDRRPPRVKFLGSSGAVYQGLFSMPDTKCQNVQLLLLDNIRDKLHPISISLTYSILEREARGRSAVRSLDNFPVLSEDQSKSEELEIHFQKECGSDNVCRSNLGIQYEYVVGNTPLSKVNGSQVLHYDQSVKKVNLNVIVTNFPSVTSPADDAHEAVLNITVPPELVFSSVRPPLACTLKDTIICELGFPFKRNQKAEITIVFEAVGISLKTREVVAGLQLSTLSRQDDLHEEYAKFLVDYTIKMSFSVQPSHIQTYFSGNVMGESAMKTAQEVGSPVEYSFTVNNDGEPLTSLATLFIAVHWPHEVVNGKWLLYPTEVLVNTGTVKACHPSGNVINPLNLTVSDTSVKRRRREVVDIPDVRTLAATKRESSEVVLKCSGGGATCVHFSCPLNDMKVVAEITIRGRVWNSTFLEDYRNVDRVWVIGGAELYLKTDVPSINMKSQFVTFSVAIDSELVEPPPAELPLWLIIVSVVSGILLLGIIILLLWKCGFFRRANTRAMYEVRGQKAEMKVQPSETERLTQDY